MMDSGLGRSKHARSIFVGWRKSSLRGAFLWVGGHKSSVLNPTKKVFLRASTHGAFLWVITNLGSEPDKKSVFEFVGAGRGGSWWGGGRSSGGGGVPGPGRKWGLGDGFRAREE